jgi:PAS domain S-box-containing protein
MSKPKVGAKEALTDIRAGMDDAALMKKYMLSAKGLHSLFKKLVDNGVLRQAEIEDRIVEPEGSLVIDFSTLSPVSTADKAPPIPVRFRTDETRLALVISDDVALADRLSRIAHLDGLFMQASAGGSCTPELLGEVSPDMILADIGLADSGYIDVIRNARIHDDGVPVILVSDTAHDQEAARGLAEGAYDLVDMSAPEFVVTRSLERALEHGELQRVKRDQSRIIEQAVKEQTHELLNAKDFLKGILDSSTLVSVVLTDLDQKVRFWNKGAENIMGYTSEEMIGTKITRLYPPDALTQGTIEDIRALVANKTGTVHTKMKQVAKDGRVVTVALSLSPMLDRAGGLEGILGMRLDVTEEVRQNREILRLVQKIKQAQDVAIITLVSLTEAREGGSGAKPARIQEYCRALCQGLATRDEHTEVLTQKYTEDLVRSAVLYDVGKVALPDEILLFPGVFGPKQWEIMKQHPLIAGRALQDAVKKLGTESFLTLGMEMAFYHHERWDGTGYPFGLKEEEIPLSARIVAVADVYDALTNDRLHRPGISHDQACAIIKDERGRQFDPLIADEFAEIHMEFRVIRCALTECELK